MQHLIRWPLQPHVVLSSETCQYSGNKCLSACLSAMNATEYWRYSSEQILVLKEPTAEAEEGRKGLYLFRAMAGSHARIIEIRFIDVRQSQPKKNVGLCLLCFASNPLLSGPSVVASLDYGFLYFGLRRMGRD